MSAPDWHNQVRLHIRKFWPQSRISEFRWKSGPIPTSFHEFAVELIEPAKAEDDWIYVTVGASEIHGLYGEHSEFFLLARQEDPSLVEILAMAANFHADPRYGVCVGKILDIGRPWIEGSLCDHLLVSLPYPLGKDFEWSVYKEVAIRFLWLLPITPSEAEVVHVHGIEELEHELEVQAVDYSDPYRQSVA